MLGCKCGRFEWEMRQKEALKAHLRNIALNPQVGSFYIISRPPDASYDHGEVPFRVWTKCEGKRIEVDVVEEDENVSGVWWCWCDVSHITKQKDDQYWFPHDGLLLLG